MGTTEGKVQIGTLDSGTEADADDFEILHEASGNADDHVLNEAAGGAVEGAVLAEFAVTGNGDSTVFGFERDAFRKREVEFALRAFDDHGASIEFDGDFFGKRDWFETDS
ncbi:hypothetical protein GCM10023212_21850 [Luteolibacter yonseiensis]